MKQTRTIKLENGFYVKITVKNTGDNYTQFASIFNPKSESPYFGTCFKDTETNARIKEWANERINAPHNNHLLSQLS